MDIKDDSIDVNDLLHESSKRRATAVYVDVKTEIVVDTDLHHRLPSVISEGCTPDAPRILEETSNSTIIHQKMPSSIIEGSTMPPAHEEETKPETSGYTTSVLSIGNEPNGTDSCTKSSIKKSKSDKVKKHVSIKSQEVGYGVGQYRLNIFRPTVPHLQERPSKYRRHRRKIGGASGRHHTQDPYRWVALLQLFLLTFGAASCITTHGIVVREYRLLYGISVADLHLLSIIFNWSYLLFGGLIICILAKCGLKGGMRFGSALFFIGCGLKQLSTQYPFYELLVTAQVLQCIALYVAITSPSLLAATWFPQRQRPLATTIACQGFNLGIVFSVMLPPIILSYDNYRAIFMKIVYGVLFAISCCEFILTFVVVPTVPKQRSKRINFVGKVTENSPLISVAVHDSKGEEHNEAMHYIREHHDMSLINNIKNLLCDKRYILLCLSAALSVGVHWTYNALFARILLPFGITQQECRIIEKYRILLSVLPAILFARRVGFHQGHKWYLIMSAACCWVCLLVLIVTVIADISHPFWIMCLIHTPWGVAQALQGPLYIEYMRNISFPIDASISTGLFLYILNVMYLLLISVAPVLIPAQSATAAQAIIFIWGLVIMLVVSVILLVFVDEPRQPNEKRRNRRNLM